MTIVSVGAFLSDYYMFGDRLPQPGESVEFDDFSVQPGGKAVNQAIASRRLGRAATVVCAVGTDERGEGAVALLEGEGLDTTHVITDSTEATGCSFITADYGGNHTIATWPGASKYLTPAAAALAVGNLAPSVLLIQGEIPEETNLAALSAAPADCITVLDPSPAEAISHELLSSVSVVTPNQQEASLLLETSPASAQHFNEKYGVQIVLLTKGSAGVDVYVDGSAYHVPSTATNVIDTSGAGDAFLGGFAASIASRRTVRKAVEFAVAVAAISVSRRYCAPSFPTSAEIPGGVPWTPDPLSAASGLAVK